MIRFLALVAVIAGAVYGDLRGAGFAERLLFPALVVAGVVVLIGWRLSVVAALGGLAVWRSDLASTSVLEGVVLPLFAVACFFYILVKKVSLEGGGASGGGDGGGDFGGFDGGGE